MIDVSYVPSRCASSVISSLSKPTSGRRIGSVATLADRGEIVDRLRRDLADRVAGDERVRARSSMASRSAIRIIRRR